MANNDVFANIAGSYTGGRKELLEEILPKKFEKKLFEVSKKDGDIYIDKSYEENKKEYYAGLEILKEQFAPFLVRYPKDILKRQRVDINNFFYSINKETKKVTIPHYEGPVGKATAFYKTSVDISSLNNNKSKYIVFKGVDYICDVYINDEFIGHHEGMFAPFEFNISHINQNEINLLVKVRNELPTIGHNGMSPNGDKLYAATGLGWDNPEDGWHHCPAGMGIYNSVYIEQREDIYIQDIFVRPDIDKKKVSVSVTIYNQLTQIINKDIDVVITPYNFNDKFEKKVSENVEIDHGFNYYYFEVEIDDMRLWDCDNPYMYVCQSYMEKSSYEVKFGMRKFHMDEIDQPKGTLYFNNNPIILRGANEMGHLQLCVTRNDYDQLIEDILIAKYANMNCYRITQRPVQEEIYDYCDMLGMLNQVDMPLFGYMRKNQFIEGVKQAGEMEDLVKNHPSVIMASYINEPFDPSKYGLAHRHLSRVELELFFDALDAIIHFKNPDRVIKRVEGDYDPPTNKGLSDFHCYNMWYTNHALPIGKLYKGYLPAIKKGWKVGCGEYGAEGLDNLEVMEEYYPKEWLPSDNKDEWIPDKIIKSQTNTMHGDWYYEQSTINDWIEQSQIHQGFATKLMTDAFRRKNDILIYTAIHLLIDAWPSGWMKTLLDVNRVPKRGFFDFKESLIPLKCNLRCDRWSCYIDEVLEVEAWVLNDTYKSYDNLSMRATIKGKKYELNNILIDGCNSKVVGVIPVEFLEEGENNIDLALYNNGVLVNVDRLVIKVHKRESDYYNVYPIGEEAKKVINDSEILHLCEYEKECNILVSDNNEYIKMYDNLIGGKRIFMTPKDGSTKYIINNKEYKYNLIFEEEVGENCDQKGLSFVGVSEDMQDKFHKNDFAYLYNSNREYIDFSSTHYISGEFESVDLFAYEKPGWGKKVEGKKKKLAVVGNIDEYNTCVSLELLGRLNYNPSIDKLLSYILKEK